MCSSANHNNIVDIQSAFNDFKEKVERNKISDQGLSYDDKFKKYTDFRMELAKIRANVQPGTKLDNEILAYDIKLIKSQIQQNEV